MRRHTKRLAIAVGLSLAALLLLGAVTGANTPRPSGTSRHCAGFHEPIPQTVTRISARGIGCNLARRGIATYAGAPQSCITDNFCGQSGIGNKSGTDTKQGSYVRCHRRGHRVRCTVVYPPHRGSVRFVIHPIGYPGLSGTLP